TDQQDNLASFSYFGDWFDVAAPGVRILSSYIGVRPSYAFASGTSMATSHVAGLAGLLASQRRSNANIRAVIEATTDRAVSYPIANSRNGRINAHRAVDTR
ncbi:MAG: S8 family serine peptidase, partial [Candidatus Latescibacteria bacterium]|nr:S8 family serine peptidase [Candidatus Latescibacterota bacterium]